jgi:hypothetical protein
LVFASSGDWVIFKEWMNDRDYAFDIGMIHVTEDIFSTMCGYLGWIYNYIAPQMECIGYPAAPNPPIQRNDMYSVTGVTYVVPWESYHVIMINNDMRGGVSGSPWIATVDGGLYVNGVASGYRDDEPSHLYSPKFDDKFQRLWDDAQS